MMWYIPMAGNTNTNGFEDLAKELEQLASRITDEKLKKRVLKIAAKPVVQLAKSIARRIFTTRTGNLLKSLGDTYNPRTGKQSIGWKNSGSRGLGFYGFFHEVGYKPFVGEGSLNQKISLYNRRKTVARGDTIRQPHLQEAMDAKREEVKRRMIYQYQKVLKK